MNDGDVRSHNHSACTAGLYPDATKTSCVPTWRESRWVDSFLFVTPEEDPGVTGEKQIGDLLMQMEKYKSAICFSSVTPGSSSGVTMTSMKILNKA